MLTTILAVVGGLALTVAVAAVIASALLLWTRGYDGTSFAISLHPWIGFYRHHGDWPAEATAIGMGWVTLWLFGLDFDFWLEEVWATISNEYENIGDYAYSDGYNLGYREGLRSSNRDPGPPPRVVTGAPPPDRGGMHHRYYEY